MGEYLVLLQVEPVGETQLLPAVTMADLGYWLSAALVVAAPLNKITTIPFVNRVTSKLCFHSQKLIVGAEDTYNSRLIQELITI